MNTYGEVCATVAGEQETTYAVEGRVIEYPEPYLPVYTSLPVDMRKALMIPRASFIQISYFHTMNAMGWFSQGIEAI